MRNVLVPLAQGCEELEAVTVIDLLRRAGIQVVTAGLDDRPVKASRGTVLVPDLDLDAALEKSYDMIVLPGGQPGSDNLNADLRIQKLVQILAAKADTYVAAICAAPKVLAQAGVLKGKRATCFPGAIHQFSFPDIALTGNSIERDGNIITSKGPGTAMDFALVLIDILVGKAKRDEVELALQRPRA